MKKIVRIDKNSKIAGSQDSSLETVIMRGVRETVAQATVNTLNHNAVNGVYFRVDEDKK